MGYSAKAKGIAGDLGQGEYVVDVSNIDEKDFVEKFFEMISNSSEVKKILAEKASQSTKRAAAEACLKILI